MEDILVLGIESSCDETAAAVVKNGREVLSNVINSQIDIHKRYGGVVPEIASRCHIEAVNAVVDEALLKAGVTFDDIDVIAVTYGPGLVGALLVGVATAKALAYALKKPLVNVHHIKGHICANFVEHKNLEPPFTCLVASGGHSHILHIKDYHSFDVLGATTDDAAGEAFDKVARVLGLGYPGGPKVNNLAESGNCDAIKFPRPSLGYNFSFSGLKTAVINYVHTAEQKGEKINKADVAASFQKAAIDVLVNNTVNAAKAVGADKIAIAGGVAANTALRIQMENCAKESGISFYCPPIDMCTDNAAMISCAGYLNYEAGIRGELELNAVAQLSLGDVL